MKNIKTIITAFSGLFIYASLFMSLRFIFGDNILGQKITLSFVFILFGFLYLTVVTKPFGFKEDISKKYVVLSLGCMTALSIAGIFSADFILKTIGDSNFQQIGDDTKMLSRGLLVLSSCISIFLTPIVEEIIFRGFMYRYLSKFGNIFALVLSSLVFALIHGTLVHLYVAFMGGLILAAVYEKTKRLSFSIALHIFYNFIATILGLFKYPVFISKLIPVIIFNLILVTVVFFLLKISMFEPAQAIIVETEAQRKEKEETRKAVDDAMRKPIKDTTVDTEQEVVDDAMFESIQAIIVETEAQKQEKKEKQEKQEIQKAVDDVVRRFAERKKE